MKLFVIFFARDQFLDSCSRELYVHLKPKSFKNLRHYVWMIHYMT